MDDSADPFSYRMKLRPRRQFSIPSASASSAVNAASCMQHHRKRNRSGDPTTTSSPNVSPPGSPKAQSEPGSPSRSPESNCPICLGKMQNKSFTDSCFHQFCFKCLLSWSKIKAECPLCKQKFTSIIHNVRSLEDYDQYHLPPGHNISNDFEQRTFEEIGITREPRFRYRTTMTDSRRAELALQRIPVSSRSLSFQAMMRRSGYHNRPMMNGTSEFRRHIYDAQLWARPVLGEGGRNTRYRESSAEFYRDNPGVTHRLIPWLNRELNVLFRNDEATVINVLRMVMEGIQRNDIRSTEFHSQMQPYLQEYTDHFVHEFYQFAIAPYDMSTYDTLVEYHHNPRSGSADSTTRPEIDGRAPTPPLLTQPFRRPEIVIMCEPSFHVYSSPGGSSVSVSTAPETSSSEPTVHVYGSHGVRVITRPSAPATETAPRPVVTLSDSDSDDITIVEERVQPRARSSRTASNIPPTADFGQFFNWLMSSASGSLPTDSNPEPPSNIRNVMKQIFAQRSNRDVPSTSTGTTTGTSREEQTRKRKERHRRNRFTSSMDDWSSSSDTSDSDYSPLVSQDSPAIAVVDDDSPVPEANNPPPQSPSPIADDDEDVEIVGFIKPRADRTPVIVSLSDSDTDIEIMDCIPAPDAGRPNSTSSEEIDIETESPVRVSSPENILAENNTDVNNSTSVLALADAALLSTSPETQPEESLPHSTSLDPKPLDTSLLEFDENFVDGQYGTISRQHDSDSRSSSNSETVNEYRKYKLKSSIGFKHVLSLADTNPGTSTGISSTSTSSESSLDSPVAGPSWRFDSGSSDSEQEIRGRSKFKRMRDSSSSSDESERKSRRRKKHKKRSKKSRKSSPLSFLKKKKKHKAKVLSDESGDCDPVSAV